MPLTRAVKLLYSPNAPRVILVVLASGWVVIGLGTLGDKIIWWSNLWGVLFLFAGVTCVLAAINWPRPVYSALAGATTIVATLGRGLAIGSAKVLGYGVVATFSWWRVLVGVTTWWVLAFALMVLFFRRMEPLASESRTRN